MKELLFRLEKQYKEEKPFVLFAQPDSMKLIAHFQNEKDSITSDGQSKPSFIFHPFGLESQGYVIPKEQASIFETDFDESVLSPHEVEIHDNPNEEDAYKLLVKKAKEWIERKRLVKIVTSRRHVEKLKSFDLVHLVNALFSLYPTAFRYIWFHPETGFWCGATPELLIESAGECFNTMALAGTQYPDSLGRILWTDKEREEQQLVIDDITDKLQKVLSVIKISKTKNHVAGSVVHLRTDISGCVKKGKNSLFDIVQTLHPTPAVCGTPTKKAREFIEQHEGYNREFYTGFLGVLGATDEKSSLYVNLRCMKIDQGIASIYVGGGITAASDVEAEWIETENKLHTMLQVIQPFL